jgi:hypothetical protein
MVDAKVEIDFSARRGNVEYVDIFVKLGTVIETASN